MTLVFSKKKGLVHEVGQVCDRWDAVAVETSDCYFGKKMVQEHPVD
jgi:hypothetical protein